MPRTFMAGSLEATRLLLTKLITLNTVQVAGDKEIFLIDISLVLS